MSYALVRNTILLFLSMFFVTEISAATIAQIRIAELVEKSELIFHGKVSSVSSELNSSGRIYTYVDFLVEETLSGTKPDSKTITLRFTGGSVGNQKLDVGITYPNVGEEGVYFVERTSFGLINPLLGWFQGHFKVNENGYMTTASDKEIYEIRNISSEQQNRISRGAALGVLTSTEKANESGISSLKNGPMTIGEFKSKISSFLVNP